MRTGAGKKPGDGRSLRKLIVDSTVEAVGIVLSIKLIWLDADNTFFIHKRQSYTSIEREAAPAIPENWRSALKQPTEPARHGTSALTLVGTEFPVQSTVIFVASRQTGFTPNAGGGDGNLCLGGGIGRSLGPSRPPQAHKTRSLNLLFTPRIAGYDP